MEIESRILNTAKDHFLRRGIRSVTMDEIAGTLGISKKTLYQHYRNKAEIVYYVTRAYLRKEIDRSNAITEEASDAIDEEFRILRWTQGIFRNMSPTVSLEIRKYYPRAWRLIEAFRNGHVLKKISDNLERGIREGVYRAEIQVEILALIRLSQNNLLIEPTYFSNRQPDPVQLSVHLFELYLRGIVSEQGRVLLETYLEQLGSATTDFPDNPINPV